VSDATTAFTTAETQINADVNAGASYNPPFTPAVLSATGHFGLPAGESLANNRTPFSVPAIATDFLDYTTHYEPDTTPQLRRNRRGAAMSLRAL
jgi:hypothetical protein